MVRKFIAILIVAILALSVTSAAAEPDMYPKAAVVVTINIFDESITVEDGEGNLWVICNIFDEETDIELGDVVAMLMWTSQTEEIEDDEVIEVVFEHFKDK